MEELRFQFSEEDIDDMIAMSTPEETNSTDLYDVEEIINRITPEEMAVCDRVYHLDDTCETLERFLLESSEIKAKYGFLEPIAFNELTNRYLPKNKHYQLIKEIPPHATTEQVVLRKPSNNSRNTRPQTVRLRNRQQPGQMFRSR